ncbi:MAG: 50S ribosomal protein L23 [Thaumarchaeota archaeon]|nr:50S ribosomal protein L23 [Nitrososphaerota archaeon]
MRSEDALKIVVRPYMTEKTFDMLEKQNKLVFIVDVNANKGSVKQAVETLYNVKVDSVNTAKTIVGKKAYVRLSKESSASDVASKLGLM